MVETKEQRAADDKKQSKIEDYLTGPRRKRKNFVHHVVSYFSQSGNSE